MKRIGIDIRNIGKKRTGDEAVFFNLVKNLALIDNENNYLLFTDITDKEKLVEMQNELGIENKNNFKIISLKSSNKFTWNAWTLPLYLRKNPVDIYQTQYITPFFVSRKIKIVTIIHDISFNFYPQLIKFSDLFFLKILIPRSLKRADEIVAVSEFTADEIKRYYKINPEKITCIYNAVTESFLKKEFFAEKVEKIKKHYGIAGKFIFYLGTMQPRKNLPLLIEAYNEIRREIPGIKLVLAGGKNAYNFDPKIEKIIKESEFKENIILPGFINEADKIYLYKAAWCFCFPSLYEGFGIPILEAMTMGVPVLASDIQPHKEIAENNILFFEKENKEDLKNKLIKICLDNNLRKELTEKETKQAEKFSWKNSADKFSLIYAKL